MCCQLPLPLSSPSVKLMIMALEEYGYQIRRGIRVVVANVKVFVVLIDGRVMVLRLSPGGRRRVSASGGRRYGWILESLSQELYVGQVYSKIAFEVWTELKETYDKMDGEESHRGLYPSVYANIKSQPAAFVVKTNNNTNNFNRMVNTNNNNTNIGPNPNMLCKNCGLIGHIMDRCYELIGYPAGFKRNPNLSKQFGNTKRFNANSEFYQSAPSNSGSLSASFTNEQMMKLLSLISEKPFPNADMSDMFNFMDTYNLVLIVGYPNGTLGMITVIGSLRLTSGIVLFDVLVVPKYNFSLLFVNKMIKDGKFFVGFDEHKCYVQDLKLGKIVGTGSETDGLYLSDVNKNGLAKHTREHFPLSDHKSVFVGDLVHYDIWGPYMVISKDGYEYFLTLVDAFSRAVWVYFLKSKN
ncbi:ribonuclease H-like domain-containing protein [Tanacetum coccineum]